MKNLILLFCCFFLLTTYVGAGAQGTVIRTWGANSTGQLGDGSDLEKLSPVAINDAMIPSLIASGSNHTMCILRGGQLWAWGRNEEGQLGIGGGSAKEEAPVRVGTDSNWRQVWCGFEHTLAIKRDSTLWAWGSNTYGCLGDGTEEMRETPVRIGDDADWKVASAGGTFSLAIKYDGTLWAWGGNRYGQLGLGNTQNMNTPTQVGLDNDWVMVSAGNFHTLAIKADGSLWAWGDNAFGQLGNGTTASQTLPTLISYGWLWVSSGFTHSAGIRSNRSLWGWGRNHFGQVGDGTTENRLRPTPAGGSRQWLALSCAGDHSLAIDSGSTLWSWGRNDMGQLGLGNRNDRAAPVQLSDSRRWRQVAAGYRHSAALEARNDSIEVLLPSSVDICLGDTVTLTAEVEGGRGTLSFRWSPTEGLSSSSSASIRMSPEKDKTYRLVVRDEYGGTTSVDVMVRVHRIPKLHFEGDTAICAGQNVRLQPVLTGGGTGTVSYRWEPAEGLSSAVAAQPIASPARTTTYRLRIYNAGGCEEIDSLTVFVHDLSAVDVFPASADFGRQLHCQGTDSLTVEIRNPLSEPVEITLINPPSLFVLSSVPTFPAVLEPNSALRITIVTPAGVYPQASEVLTLSAAADKCKQMLSVPISVIFDSLDIAVEEDIDFGMMAACDQARDTVVMIHNRGKSEVNLAAVDLPEWLQLAQPVPLSIQPTSSAPLALRFVPTSTGTYSSDMVLRFTECGQELKISVVGQKEGFILKTPDTLDIGVLLRCSRSPASVTGIIELLGTGTSAAQITDVSADAPIITSLAADTEVRNGEPVPFTVSFGDVSSLPLGQYVAELTLTYMPCEGRRTIIVKATIEDPSLECQPVEMGTVVVGAKRQAETYIVNTTAEPLFVGSIYNPGAPFAVLGTQPPLPAWLASGDTLRIELLFSPESEGIYVTELRAAVVEPCEYTTTATLRGSAVQASLFAQEDINLGEICIGKMLSTSVSISNMGSGAVSITELRIQGSSEYSLGLFNVPFSLSPGEAASATVLYYPTAQGDAVATISWVSADTVASTRIAATASSCIPPFACFVSASNVEAQAGDTVAWALILDSALYFNHPAAPSEFEARIAINRNVFFPDGQWTCTPSADDNICILNIRGRRLWGDTLAIIRGIATLGNTDFASIAIREFRWLDTVDVSTQTRDGSIRITGICNEGVVRLYLPSEYSYALQSMPNPADQSITIRYGLAETATVGIDLINTAGAVVGTPLPTATFPPGYYSIEFPTHNISAGVYFLRLQAENSTLFYRVDIQH